MQRRAFLKSIIWAGAATLLGGTACAYRSSRLEISYKRLYLSGIMEKLRVAALSDVHAPCIHSSLMDLIRTVNGSSPDIFLLAGDIVDTAGHEGVVNGFKKIKARHAKIAGLGNWEYLGNINLERLREEYERAGILLLVNEALNVKNTWIVGLDDLVLGSPDYEVLGSIASPESPILVINHCPGNFDYMTAFSESPLLVFAGHTHGGQIAPFGIALVTPEGSGPYLHGWYRKGQGVMYVMRGIGTTPGIPFRIGSRPELLVLDLIPA